MGPDGFALSSNPPQKLGEIEAELQGHLVQEFVDKLEVMRHPAIVTSPRAKALLRRWTVQRAIKNDRSCSTSCARYAVVSGCYPNRCMWKDH